MTRESRVGKCRSTAVACAAMACLLVMSSSAWGILVDASANLGAVAPDPGTGLRGQFFDSGGTVADIRTLLAASTAP
ncbi:MAG: hypothetical protein WD768_04770, partial [Phycisphaeraceae bacterium]